MWCVAIALMSAFAGLFVGFCIGQSDQARIRSIDIRSDSLLGFPGDEKRCHCATHHRRTP